MMQVFMCSMQIRKVLTSGRLLQMQVFIFLVLAYGRNRVLFSEEVHISGSMNLVCLDGRRTVDKKFVYTVDVSIPAEKKLPYGNLISRRRMVTIQP